VRTLAIVLHHPRNPLNIGAVARAMSNFGAQDLRLVSPFHQNYREAASATGPAPLILARAREYPTLPDALADCTLALGTTGAVGRAWTTPPELLDQAAPQIRARLGAGERVALVFGPEKTGLSNDDLSLCHATLHIPTADEHSSMNLGQAAAVCLYELARTVAPPAPPSPPAAPAGDLLRLDALLHETLRAAGYPAISTAHRVRQLRLLTRRLHLSPEDTPHWTGILRHILWKLRAHQQDGEHS
jgi:TrmH family RNA methyltransferase